MQRQQVVGHSQQDEDEGPEGGEVEAEVTVEEGKEHEGHHECYVHAVQRHRGLRGRMEVAGVRVEAKL